jgi:hypothetical protein
LNLGGAIAHAVITATSRQARKTLMKGAIAHAVITATADYRWLIA